ncbi:MAG: DUF3047 domain-containing protein [candidate division NC10 bacterium]|nr:DUF3047 domain-containing protein [candidate division NC10 bacterium]
MGKRIASVLLAAAFLLSPLLLSPSGFGQGGSAEVIEVGKFSAAPMGDTPPPDWKPFAFKKIERHTHYSIVRDGDTTVVKATAVASASGLIREIQIDPREYGIVQWRWKAGNILKKGDIHRKEGDDYPARLYITFAYDPARLRFSERARYEAARLLYGRVPPLAAINYIWESKAPQGTVVPNPYTERVKMIVVESGEEKLNHWISEERNLCQDYRQAFGEDPPLISGVAIMADTDNTGETATAYYGDILFRRGNSGE